MDEHSRLYIEQMGLWFKEQEIIEKQIERAVEYHSELARSHGRVASSNVLQLNAHRDRMEIAKKEFEEWKKDNEIGVEDSESNN